MPSIKYVIELSNQEKVRLMEIVKKGNSPARTILRANILLASDKQNDRYMTVSEIANAYRTTPTTVQTVRTSSCKKGLVLQRQTDVHHSAGRFCSIGSIECIGGAGAVCSGGHLHSGIRWYRAVTGPEAEAHNYQAGHR